MNMINCAEYLSVKYILIDVEYSQYQDDNNFGLKPLKADKRIANNF